MRTIEIPLPDELLQLVDERARTAGVPREAYIRAVLSRDVSAEPSISEILAPFRDQVESSGISDDALDQLFSEAREEARTDRNSRTFDER